MLRHPNDVPASEENAAFHGCVEYQIYVARAYTRLVLNLLVRYTGIRWIVAHAGGVVPFLAERLGNARYTTGIRLAGGGSSRTSFSSGTADWS